MSKEADKVVLRYVETTTDAGTGEAFDNTTELPITWRTVTMSLRDKVMEIRVKASAENDAVAVRLEQIRDDAAKAESQGKSGAVGASAEAARLSDESLRIVDRMNIAVARVAIDRKQLTTDQRAMLDNDLFWECVDIVALRDAVVTFRQASGL